MALRRGSGFLDSLKDGREVWVRGARVPDVTTHPSLAGCAHSLADLYDLQHDPVHRELLTMASPSSGEPVSLGYLLPHTPDDLARRRRMIEFLMRRTGGVAGRLPEYMAIILVGLYDARDILGEADPAFATNAAAYFEYCRDQDLCLTHGFADPPRDRALPPDGFERFHVVESRADGIVVRGAKAVATLAPYANEYLGLTPPGRGTAPAEVVYFATPLATPGIRIVCRRPLAHEPSDDYPLSARYDEMDAWVIFDDVFIPRKRVFFLERSERIGELFGRILAWAGYHILIRMAVKAEVLAGICVAITDYLGTTRLPHVETLLCDAIGYVETLRAFISAAEREAAPSPSGLLAPHFAQVTLGRIFGVERHPHILQVVRELCGSSLLMAPGQDDMASPEINPEITRYLVAGDERAPDRFRLLKLAWEYAADAFGSRQLLFEMYNANTLAANRARVLSTYRTAPLADLAKSLAGIPVS